MIEDEKIIELFFERSEQAIRNLDSKYGYVKKAINYQPKQKKHNLFKWFSMAACLCLVVCAFAIPHLLEKPHNSASGDLFPMIYVNDTLYRIASNQSDITGKEGQFVYLGIISSKVCSSQYPQENFQANDDGTYTCRGNTYKYMLEVSGVDGESQITYIILTNNEETDFEDVRYSLIKAEMSTGTPEFVILGWYY